MHFFFKFWKQKLEHIYNKNKTTQNLYKKLSAQYGPPLESSGLQGSVAPLL